MSWLGIEDVLSSSQVRVNVSESMKLLKLASTEKKTSFRAAVWRKGSAFRKTDDHLGDLSLEQCEPVFLVLFVSFIVVILW